MEEKERFELIGYCSYRDTETGVVGDNFVDLLNQQDKEIIKLRGENQQLKQSQNQVAIKELEKLKDDLLENFGQSSPLANRVDLVVKINEQIENLKG